MNVLAVFRGVQGWFYAVQTSNMLMTKPAKVGACARRNGQRNMHIAIEPVSSFAIFAKAKGKSVGYESCD